MEKTIIQVLEEEIAQKKLLLKAMKADEKEKNKKLFAETKFGQVCLKSLKTVTSPFKNMHERASFVLENPVLANFSDLEAEATKLIASAEGMTNSHPGATKLANRCAQVFLEMDVQASKHELLAKAGEKTLAGLRTTIERLRPPMNPDQFNVLNEQLAAAVPQV